MFLHKVCTATVQEVRLRIGKFKMYVKEEGIFAVGDGKPTFTHLFALIC